VQHGITCSMSRRANRYDNVVIESWFSTVKGEEGFPATRDEVRST
jgi:transposase InsO family protein